MALRFFSLMNYYESSQNHYHPDSPEGYEIGGKNVMEHPELADLTIPIYQKKRRLRLFSSFMGEETCWCLSTKAASFIIICESWEKR